MKEKISFRNPEKQKMLSEEAKRRGFVGGTKYKSLDYFGNVQTIGGPDHVDPTFSYLGHSLMDKSEKLTDGWCGICWRDGEWAEIVELSPKLSLTDYYKIKYHTKTESVKTQD